MSFQKKKKSSIWLVGILVFMLFCLFCLFSKKQPEGEYITLKEVEVLTNLLHNVRNQAVTYNLSEGGDKKILFDTEVILKGDSSSYFTYGQFQDWISYLQEEFSVSNLEEVKPLEQKYGKKFFVLKEDLYGCFDEICFQLDTLEKIHKETLLVIGDDQNTIDLEGNSIGEDEVITQKGKWGSMLPKEFLSWQNQATYITYAGYLWGVCEVQEEGCLENVWIMEEFPDKLHYFYQNFEIETSKEESGEIVREQVGDLYFLDGNLSRINVKQEKITGRVLKLSSEELELEGAGTYPLSPNVQFYQLYGRLETLDRKSVRLGYDFTDFVVEDGAIQAGLLVKDETMDHIRILIKNSDFSGNYHEEIICKSDVDLEIIYGNQKEILPAGETLQFDCNSRYVANSRVFIRPLALTGKIYFPGIQRNNHGQGYRGTFEIEKGEEGLLLINEVLLEEYLYTVVPSEMPAYYPLEALKAQAICARTYAYNKMEKPSLSGLGANMDDSSSYQVYNNIKENGNATKAVKETKGKLLYNGEQKADTYYYSTSCGFGTNASIWNNEGNNPCSYLQAKEMTMEKGTFTGSMLQKEEEFETFIEHTYSNHFESGEGWYRWKYEHSNIEKIAEKLKTRQEKYPSYILTGKDGETFSQNTIADHFSIQNIEVKKRGEGGTIAELLITTNQEQILVKNEYHIRAVLTDGESEVQLHNDKTYACGNLLPSAFFVIQQNKENGKVTGICLKGGGFGHGVGMSQNGAKNLAALGYGAEQILSFYYQDCYVK